MSGLVSIIIPVYNVEKYLPICIESVVNQTYRALELLLIDDGSTDNSGKICDEYAGKDSRIKVLHKENGGVSLARNIGLDKASGEYIAFIDSDDIIEADMIERLIYEMDDDTDIVECEFYEFYEYDKKGRINKYTNAYYGEICDKTQALIGFFDGTIKWSIWNKLYKAKLLKNIRFDTNLRVGEDALFVINCCDKANKIKEIPYCGYGYLQRVDSVTNETLNEKKWKIFEFIDKIKKEYTSKEVLPYIILCEYNYCKAYIRNILKDGIYKEKLKELRRKILANKKTLYASELLTRFNKYFIIALRFTPHLLYLCIWLYIKVRKRRAK
ncbi:MAG: glycosyltransferase [Clostridia bacterium]|nr:glycosyltransferase [Clostridia bacterium]